VVGTVDLNGISILNVSGTGSSDTTVSPLQYSYVLAGVTSSVSSGSVVTFPPTPITQTASARFTIANNGADAVRIVNIGFSENQNVYQLTGLPSLPAQIASKQSLTFTITFAPVSPGGAAATLNIDNARFLITGSAPAPSALPSYTFTGASGTQQAFQQPAIGLSLASAYPIDVQGTLTISTVSDTFAQDPAVRFATGGTTVAFTIPANTLQARFPGGATQIQLQTGTVAGAILITPSFAVNSINLTPSNATTLRLDVAKAAPVLLTGSIPSRS